VASLLAGTLAADEGLKGQDSVTMTNIQANPLMLLPGMQPVAPTRTPLKASAPAVLPTPVISNLTNYPNPFDSRRAGLLGQTSIEYQLSVDARVSIVIYDLLGARVKGWDFNPGDNGAHQGDNHILWDGTNEAGQKVSKGGYIAEIQIETPQTTVTAIRKIGVIH
jgi:hypothetical protein